MKGFKRMSLVLAVLATTAWSGSAQAGPFADDLARCLVDQTTEADRALLVQWMFSAAALHPAVKPIASVSAEQLDTANRRTAKLFMRLLTEECTKQAVAAVKYEGPVALQLSFQVLGQIAGQELFASPEVSGAMAGLEQYLDEEKLQALGEAAN